MVRINELSAGIKGRNIIEQIISLDKILRATSSFFLFFILSYIKKAVTAAIDAHVEELFSIPTRKSEPFRNTIYPDRNTPVVNTTAAFISIPSNIKSIWLFRFSP
jgi:hypothetical protein